MGSLLFSELFDIINGERQRFDQFKKWQKDAVKKGVEFLIIEATKYADVFPQREEVQAAFYFLERREDFLKRIQRLEKAYEKAREAAEVYKKIRERCAIERTNAI
jgi:hypothetical protein